MTENTIKNDKIVKLPQIPKLEPKLKEEFLKFGIKTILSSGCNLKNLICTNKSKLLPNSFPGVYQLACTSKALYMGVPKKKVITRTIEHQQDSLNLALLRMSWTVYLDNTTKVILRS